MVDPAGAGAARARTGSLPPTLVPDPPATLHITRHVWKAGEALHRVHLEHYAGDAFNPGVRGNARFSPIARLGDGSAIPTLYGGSSFECAAMESVFHDVPFAAGLKTFDKRKLIDQMHSVLTPTADLVLADLRNVPLRKLGVERKRLIDTEKDTYPQTRRWAVAIHAHAGDVQGLCWTSRQDDRAVALVLFGDRVPPGAFDMRSKSRSLLADANAYMALLELVDAIGVRVIAGRGGSFK
jgi:hypothetical protein